MTAVKALTYTHIQAIKLVHFPSEVKLLNDDIGHMTLIWMFKKKKKIFRWVVPVYFLDAHFYKIS